MKDFSQTLPTIPAEPGVYFYKDTDGKVIYVGKAVNLRNRVRQYFQQSRQRDVKTDALVEEIDQIDWVNVESEIDALFLESEMIKRYMPKYNIDLRDDKHYQYVRINFKSDHPTVRIVRRPLDDGAEYFGPYVGSVRPALKYLRKIFPFDYKKPTSAKRPSLDYHLGLSPGLEAGKGSVSKYKDDLRKLRMYLRGERSKLEKSLRVEMEKAAKNQEFELATQRRNQLRALKNLKQQIIFSDKELFDISKDQALNGLQELLELKGAPRRIEGYDISHMSGTNNVASMVVFTNGVSDKGQYRKFKMRIPGNDDFAHMHEVIIRRFSTKNLEQWPKPDLLLIDGGKGQLGAALKAFEERGLQLPAIGLAKRHETIIVPKKLENRNQKTEFQEVELSKDSHVLKLLMRIRDESHRFAVNYHSTLKSKGQTASVLEEIPGIGPKTRKKLIRTFGSMRGVQRATQEELEAAVGTSKAKTLRLHLGEEKPQ